MKKIFNSVRAKLSIILCIVIIMIIGFLVIVTNVILETLYYNSKKNSSLETYEYIKQSVEEDISADTIRELEKIALNNNYDILITKNEDVFLEDRVTNELYFPKYSCVGTFNDLIYAYLNQDNLWEVWQTRFQPFRDRRWTRRGRCAGCPVWRDCQGNGMHNWHGDCAEVINCHYRKTLGAGGE